MTFPVFSILLLSYSLPTINRRTFLTGSFYTEHIPTLSMQPVPNISIDPDDEYAHWSFFGLSPPPIERVLSHEELLNEIKENNIITIQIATQHNHVIATTVKGHRLVCQLNDDYLPTLIMESSDKFGNVPFVVLPYDEVRGTIRDMFQVYATVYGSYVGLDQFNLLPWQISGFSSIKERDEFIKSGKRPKKLIDHIKTYINKNVTKQ